jgi:acetolactate synthase-1/2/3 large subunit
MWAAQSLELRGDQRFLTSGGVGAMGFGLPAAIGTAVASDQPVVLIAGDGGFQLNIQELQTVVRNGLSLKMVVLDNKCYGMVRQFQQSYFGERYQSTYWGYSVPDFVDVARAYRVEAALARTAADVGPALDRMFRDPREPFLLHVEIDPLTNAYPKLAFGRPISEMEPFAKPTGMEST